MRRACAFLMSDAGIANNAIRDESGRRVPPYIYHAVIDPNDHFSYRSSFPAFHHPYLIEAFLNYFNYCGDLEAKRRAVELADWLISHSSPASAKWPYLPWSTFTEGKPGGFEDKDCLQPDKVGYAGLAYTRVYEVTGGRTYLDAARRAADTLVARQAWDGSWPFRVNPITGEVQKQYTAALFFNVAFLEKMFQLTGDLDYKNAQVLAWMWMMRNPVRTGNWSGLYEDIPSDVESQVHYSPLQTIRLLLRYSTSSNRSSYMRHARDLFDSTMDGLAFDDKDMGLLLHEQTAYLAATPSSAMNWSMMAAEFYLTTGEAKFRDTALDAVRMVTKYGLKPDGRTHNTVLGGKMFGDDGSWYSLGSPTVRYLYQDMGCLPELAPSDQTHLLRTTTQIRAITYTDRTLVYETLPESIDLIKVAAGFRPSVKVDGKVLSESKTLGMSNCVHFNEKSQVLLVKHVGTNVRVNLMRR